jgi:serine/threonine protein kinase
VTDEGAAEVKCRSPEIPDFELIREIGRGGFGQVWLAKNRATGLLRAVKIIPRSSSAAADPAGRELVSITRLEAIRYRRHPHLLDIHHVGQTRDFVFFVTDLADTATGAPLADPRDYAPATLDQRLSQGPASPAECLDWTRQLLLGLAALHEAGMVHRDVKPANCLFVEGQLKLADFGLLTEADSHTSRIGTQAYMPPDGQMDTRADVYATGLVIYEMLTGYPVEQFPRLADRAGSIAADPTLSALLKLALDACHIDREKRFPDARCMLAALESRVAETVQSARWLWRVAITLAATAALAITVWGVAFWSFPPRVHVNFISYPFGATILLDGKPLMADDGRTATTPCTVDNVSARVHDVGFQHPDYPDLKLGRIDFRTRRQIVGTWYSQSVVSDSE